MSRMIYINLPVKDLAVATRFYEAIGCEKNEQFSDHQASSMIWTDTITFHLLVKDYFATFTPKAISDAHATSEVLLALSHESRNAVDHTAQAAAAAGGRVDIRDPMDMGWLYNRSFEDPDGHVFEAVWVNADAIPAG
ncbi:VOC family protein [Ochrobactrum sp. RH2CCR150]|uniref:VOC family protein n=1 Tax=Ochrobactrum sp. RH2CCR150 TaxID=2587044 RepID=UPI0015F99BD8|nr:hypothetical protein [Ochrobactrum sp. RH2CCR150]